MIGRFCRRRVMRLVGYQWRLLTEMYGYRRGTWAYTKAELGWLVLVRKVALWLAICRGLDKVGI